MGVRIAPEYATFASISHYDYTSRLQTLEENDNPKFWKLINYYKNLTGIPMLVNTSLNVKGQPIVETIQDAFKTFYNSGLDSLVIGNYIVDKGNETV